MAKVKTIRGDTAVNGIILFMVLFIPVMVYFFSEGTIDNQIKIYDGLKIIDENIREYCGSDETKTSKEKKLKETRS